MKLYHYPLSAYSRKVLFGLAELGVECDGEVVPPNDPLARETLRKLNPLGTAPLLLLDDGSVIVESSIIVEHVNAMVAGSFLPREPARALEARALDRFGDAALIEPAHYLGFSARKPAESRNEAKRASMSARLRTALGMLNERLIDRAFLLGDQPTFADMAPACGVAALLFHRLDDLRDFPAVRRFWFEGIAPRPSWQRIEEASKAAPLPF